MRAALFVLVALAVPAWATPSYVATFHSIGLYWAPPGGAPDRAARVEFRAAGSSAWRRGLDLWFDPRDGEYRGSLVELEPGTTYSIRLTLEGADSHVLQGRTWSEDFPIKRVVELKPGTTHLVIEASDSGSEREGYVVFTAPPGRNVIDQSGVAGDDPRDSCVVVRDGAHHVIVRGLELRNCKRHAVLLERQARAAGGTTSDIVIEDNVISGWGGFGLAKPGEAEWDGAIHCNFSREPEAARKPTRIVVQRNRIHNPRHGANPWESATTPRTHPQGPQAVTFRSCGTNQVFRYNEIYSTNGKHFLDGIGGGANFSREGFPWADSDLYGNRISDVYDDGIEAEGANRNVRIWGNYFDRVFVAIGNAATAVGPLYVWRNVSNRMANMYNPDIDPDRELRGPFVKAGSNAPQANGGRAYYFHNTALQPPPARGAKLGSGAGAGIMKAGGKLYNFVSRNNIWSIHDRTLYSIRADCDLGPCSADFDLHNGRIGNAGPRPEAHGWHSAPVFQSSGKGEFWLAARSPGYGRAERIPNFNDAYARPDVGAHQSGTPPMKFGLEIKPPRTEVRSPRAAWALRSSP